MKVETAAKFKYGIWGLIGGAAIAMILGFMWGKSAEAAYEKLEAGDSRTAFLNNKLITAKFFMERLMPETALRKARIETGADSVMALDAAAF